MKRKFDSLVVVSSATISTLALAFSLQANAQTSDVATRTPSRTTLQTTRSTAAQHTWSQPQYGATTMPGARGTNRMKAQSGEDASRSGTDAIGNAYIGSDPDLARALVPCDAIGSSTRGGKRSRPDAPSDSYALGAGPGAVAGVGFDPVTGIRSMPPSVRSCISMPGDQDEASSDEKATSVYDELAPDVTNGPTGSRRPGTLTLLRPFAN
jgi:hypothetical protein